MAFKLNKNSRQKVNSKLTPMSNNSAIISTAFQDHIVKQLNLNDLIQNPWPKPTRLPKIQAKSKVDSGLSRKSSKLGQQQSKADNEIEYVLKDGVSDVASEPTLGNRY